MIAGIVAPGLLLLASTLKKRETARIWMFILTFLMIREIQKTKQDRFSERHKLLLLLTVFAQAVVIQLVGYFIW